jgi:Ser/Thr protein kinase RdoA (MazF antagonist)
VVVLHADLFLENILFHPKGQCISIGERLKDGTMVLAGYCYEHSDNLSMQRTTAFLSAYQHILPFTSFEREHFATFLRYSLLSIACERWYRLNLRFPDCRRSDSHLPVLRRMDHKHGWREMTRLMCQI